VPSLSRSLWPRIALLVIVLALLTRVSLAVLASAAGVQVGHAWPAVFGLGLIDDLRLAAVIASPFLLGAWLVPSRLMERTWLRVLRAAIVFLLTFALLFGMVSEWVFWTEFSTRFNFIAVDYLLYTHEVVANIFQSYPV